MKNIYPEIEDLIFSLKELKKMVGQGRIDNKYASEWLQEDIKDIQKICDGLEDL